MSKTLENIKTINSFVRTLILVGVLGVLGTVGFWGYIKYIQPGLEVGQLREQLHSLRVAYEEQQEELQRVKTANKLLKVDIRKARLKILETGVDEETQEDFIKVEFVELTPSGDSLCEPRTFTLQGTKVFVNGLVVKFEDQYVEQNEDFRNTSLFVFKQIYGNLDGPENGKSLDIANVANETAYGSGEERGKFEDEIWAEFWEIVNNPERRDSMGIRALHGQGVHLEQVVPGMSYIVQLRASDGISIKSERVDTN